MTTLCFFEQKKKMKRKILPIRRLRRLTLTYYFHVYEILVQSGYSKHTFLYCFLYFFHFSTYLYTGPCFKQCFSKTIYSRWNGELDVHRRRTSVWPCHLRGHAVVGTIPDLNRHLFSVGCHGDLSSCWNWNFDSFNTCKSISDQTNQKATGNDDKFKYGISLTSKAFLYFYSGTKMSLKKVNTMLSFKSVWTKRLYLFTWNTNAVGEKYMLTILCMSCSWPNSQDVKNRL